MRSDSFQAQLGERMCQLEDIEDEVAASSETALGGRSPIIEVIVSDVYGARSNIFVVKISQSQRPKL